MDFYLIGFFPKRRVTRANWESSRDGEPQHPFPEPQPVQQICSVSNCMVKRLSIFDYQELSQKSFNQYGGFNQLATAIDLCAKILDDEFDIYAYAIPEFHFQDGVAHEEEIGCVDPDEIPENSPDFLMLGYDVVEVRGCSFFCSPLTCNGQAGLNVNILNQYCLVEQESDAIKLATEFSIDKPEPGPYTIVEIWKYLGKEKGGEAT